MIDVFRVTKSAVWLIVQRETAPDQESLKLYTNFKHSILREKPRWLGNLG